MKFIFIIFLSFLTNFVFANEVEDSEVEVINLYESKSLDQMVLDNLNKDEATEEVVEDTNETDQVDTNTLEVKQIEIVNDSFIFKNQTEDLKNYLTNLENINSKILQKQIVEVLENIQLNLENEKDQEILFLIINYFKSIGQINKSYELIQRYKLNNDKNYNFYTGVKINYLLSTFQLDKACNFKEELNSNIKLNYFFFRKT